MIHSPRPTVTPVSITIFTWNLFCFEKWGRTEEVRTNDMYKHNDHYRPWRWVGLVDHKFIFLMVCVDERTWTDGRLVSRKNIPRLAKEGKKIEEFFERQLRFWKRVEKSTEKNKKRSQNCCIWRNFTRNSSRVIVHAGWLKKSQTLKFFNFISCLLQTLLWC